MINRWNKKHCVKNITALFFLFCISMFALSGCSKGTVSEAKAQKGYSLPEIMIVAMAEKNRYEEVCTDQIWGVSISDDGSSFETYLAEQIKSFMEEMKTMKLLADESQIYLTSEEKALMSEAANEYYSALAEDDIAHMGVTREDVQIVYEDYFLANKLVEELTKGVNLEVSDNEAKVITISQVKTDSKETADNMRQAAEAENADFQRCADSLGLPVSTRQLGRADESEVFENAVFSLTTGQVSEVIKNGESYYVVKCISDYDEAFTLARKEVIYKERKRKAFREIYDVFKSGVKLTYASDPWETLDLKEGKYAKDADFFGIYKKYTMQ